MAKTVDERIVEMKFDNAQFEKNCKQSIATINDLESRLNKFSGTKDIFAGLNKSANNVDFSNINNALDSVQRKFSVFGTVTDQIIRNLTTKVMGGISSAINNTIGQITSGGLERAMNIKQAQFQLEGLDVAWNKISDDINYGVESTAYGLDAAAIAASQLVASGVEFGETFGETGNSPMAKALRGISGVAAMTNSSYEDISRIFTTVAGNGKLMGEQLLQLGGRGLNAAAKMADFFNQVNDGSVEASEGVKKAIQEMTNGVHVTEQEIRKFVSDKDITVGFDIFSEAMDTTFGEHAKDANKTFTGALSNVKAALRKIGAEFYLPALDEARDVLNALREQINAVKAGVIGPGSLIEAMVKLTQHISKLAQEFLKSGKLTNSIIKTANVARDVILGIDDAISHLSGKSKTLSAVFGRPLELISTNAGRTLKYIKLMADNFVEGFMERFTSFERTGVLGRVYDDLTKIGLAMDGSFKEFLTNFKGGQIAENLKNVGSIVGETFASVGRTFNYIGGIISHFVTSVYTAFTTVFGHIGTNIQEAFKDTGIDKFLISFEDLVGTIENFFAELESNSDVWDNFTDRLIKFFGYFKSGWELLKVIVSGVGSIIEGFVVGLSAAFAPAEEFADRLKQIEEAASPIDKIFSGISVAVDYIKDKITNIIPGLGKFASALGEGLGKAFDKFKGAVGSFNIDSLFGALTAGAITNFVQSIFLILVRIKKLYEEGPIANFKETLRGINDVLSRMQEDIKADILMKQAIAVGVLALAMKTLAKIDADKLVQTGIAVSALMWELSGIMAVTEKMQGIIPKGGGLLLALAGAVFILASAMKKLADLDPKSMWTSFAAVEGLLVTMSTILIVLSKTGADVGKIAGALIGLALGVRILANALYVIAKIDPDSLLNAVLTVITLISALTASMMALSTLKVKIPASTTAAILAMSLALQMLVPVIGILGSMKPETLTKGLIALAASLGMMVGALELLSLVSKGGNAFAIAAMATAMVQMAKAMDILIPAVLIFGNMPWQRLIQGLLGFGGLLAMMSVALASLGKNALGVIGAAAALMILAGAMDILVPALLLLGSVPIPVLIQGIVGLAAVLVVLGVAATALTPAILPMMGLGAALALIGVSVFLVGAGLSAVAIALGLVAANGVVAAVALKGILVVFAETLPAIMTAFAKGLLDFANVVLSGIGTLLPKLLKTVGDIISGVLNLIKEKVPEFADTALSVIEGILNALHKHLPKILNTIGQIILDIFDFLITFTPQFAEKGLELIVSFIDGMATAVDNNGEKLESAIQHLITSVITLIPKLLLGGLKGIVDAALKLFGADEGFISGINEKIDELPGIAANAIKGLINGLTSKIQDVVEQGKEIGAKLLQGIKDKLGIHSPSVEMYKVGEFAVQGLANGITDNTNMVKSAMAGIGNMMSSEGMAYAVGLVNQTDAWKQSMQRISDLSEELKLYEKAIKETSDEQKEFKGTQNLLGDGFKDIAFNLDKVTKKFKEYKKAMEAAEKGSFEYYSAKQMAHNFKLQAQYLKQTQGKSLEEMQKAYKKNEQKIMTASSTAYAQEKVTKKAEQELKKQQEALKKAEQERKKAETTAKKKKATEADKQNLLAAQLKNIVAADKVNKAEAKLKEDQKKLTKAQDNLSSLSQKSEWYRSDISALQEARDEQARLEQEYADKIAEIEAERQQQALMAIQAVQEEHDKIKDIIKSSISQLNNLMTGAKNQINLFNNSVTGTTKKLLASMEKQITSVTDWEQKLTNLSHTGVTTGLYNAIKELGPEAKEIDVFLRMTSEEITKANDLYKRTQDMTSANLLENMKRQRQMVNTWNDDIQKLFARGASKSLLEQIVEAGPTDRAALDAILNMTDAAFKEFNSLYNDNDSLADALADNIQKAYIQAEAATGNFVTVGYQMCNGIVAGLQSGSASVTAETVAIAKESYAAACRVLGIASPSKKFIEVGQYIVQGLAKGIHNTADVAVNEETAMFDRIQDVVGSAVAFMIQTANMASTDISPRVVPLMDTSEVMSGMQQLSGLIDDSYAYRTALSVNSKLEFTRRHEELMEELISSVNGLNNDDVINEMNSIVDRIDALDQSIASMQLVMDSGELVGAILPGVDQGLGRNIVYAERGMV